MHLRYVFDSLWHSAVCKEYKCIALACGVRFGSQERLDELWRVRNEGFVLSVNGVYRENGAFSNVGMSVFKTRPADRNQRLKKLVVS
jgi:hypothetical protein